MSTPDTTDWNALLTEAKKEAVEALLRPGGNVVGIGLGTKVKDGIEQPCIRVYVNTKYDKEKPPFREEDLPAQVKVKPSYGDGVPTAVIEVGRFGRDGSLPTEEVPFGPGAPIRVSSTAPNVNSGLLGTLGAVVTDGTQRYILGCNHVLAANGRVFADRDATVVSTKFVGQEDEIASPHEHGYVKLERPNAENTVDCAIALLEDDLLVEAPDDFPTAMIEKEHLAVGRSVRKIGAVTRETRGKIVDLDVDLYVQYSFGTFLFTNQILIDGGAPAPGNPDFAMAGDSGSILITDDPEGRPRAAGLIFAASGQYAVACPMDAVLTELNLRLDADAPATQKGIRPKIAFSDVYGGTSATNGGARPVYRRYGAERQW